MVQMALLASSVTVILLKTLQCENLVKPRQLTFIDLHKAAHWPSGKVFANGPGDGVQSPVESYQRLKNGTWYLLVLIQSDSTC